MIMKDILLTIFVLISTSYFAYGQCDQPEITATPGGGDYCLNDEVTLSITGTLNNATEWKWYTGSCGGDAVENGTGTSLTVNVLETKTYFVRGENGCVGECAEIEVVLKSLTNCVDDIVEIAEEGTCKATVDYEEPVGNEDCYGEITVKLIDGSGSGASFPVGSHIETYEFTDSDGNTETCSFTITVEDTEPPAILCQEDVEVDNDEGECGAVVTYETPTATDNCGAVKVELTEGLVSGSFFPVGATIVTYTATDQAGNTSTCSFELTVNDVELPVITLSKNKTSKWPPNHKHFKLKIEDYIESVTDNCDGVAIDDIIINEASSDEELNGSGDGNTEDDIIISDDCKTVKLLAERMGGGNGRVYTVNLAVMDAHGNIGKAEIKAEISHDNGKKKSVIDDGPVYIVNGCDLVEDEAEILPVEESETASVNEGEESQLKTYPNPVTNSIVINFVPKQDDRVTIDLYNLSGKRIMHLFNGDLMKNKRYSWNYDLEKINDKIFLLLLQGQKTHRLQKVLKE